MKEAKETINPVLMTLMNNRGIREEDAEKYLHPSLSDLHDPHLLPDVEKGADILAEEIWNGSKIRVIGDYDVDGVCSAYILLSVLKSFGADADHVLPERKKHGYGLNPILIEDAHNDGVDVIVTCDNGISEARSVALAKSYGMRVIITDHHNVPDVLPEADAVIDPKIKENGEYRYPFSEICGAVVAMKFLQVLCGRTGVTEDLPLDYLDFAAFATVCDVMPLKDENRPIVKFGLSETNNTRNIGLCALIRSHSIDRVKAWHFGYTLGPCVNAAGRLETAEEAMKLFLAETEDEAAEQSECLKRLNEERKALTQLGIDDAMAQISEMDIVDKVLLLHLPDCPDSIAGIVAGKVREAVNRPVLIATGEGAVLKGSARSIPEYNLYEGMAAQKDLFEAFGGHPLAAGFSVKAENLDSLRKALNGSCSLTEEDLKPKEHVDMELPISEVTLSLLEEIELMEPFGTGNPSPLFSDNEAVFEGARRIGKDGAFLRFTLSERGENYNAVSFESADAFLEQYKDAFGELGEKRLLDGNGSEKAPITYQPKIDSWRGNVRIDYQIKHVRLGRNPGNP